MTIEQVITNVEEGSGSLEINSEELTPGRQVALGRFPGIASIILTIESEDTVREECWDMHGDALLGSHSRQEVNRENIILPLDPNKPGEIRRIVWKPPEAN